MPMYSIAARCFVVFARRFGSAALIRLSAGLSSRWPFEAAQFIAPEIARRIVFAIPILFAHIGLSTSITS